MACHWTLRQLCNDVHSVRVNAAIVVDYRFLKESICRVLLWAMLVEQGHDGYVCISREVYNVEGWERRMTEDVGRCVRQDGSCKHGKGYNSGGNPRTVLSLHVQATRSEDARARD